MVILYEISVHSRIRSQQTQFWSWFIYIGAFLAFMVGFSRIYLGVHYPFDVLIGFFIGAFFAYLAQFIFKKQVLFKQAN